MHPQLRVERDQTTPMPTRHFDEVGIIYLLMTKRAEVNRRHTRSGRSPKSVLLMCHEFLQKRGSLLRRDRRRRVGRIGRKSDETKLRQGTAGPSLPSLPTEPAMSERMMLVVRPGQRKQHLGVELCRIHVASSAKSFCARLLGITGASAATWKIGSPFFREALAALRKPRRASSESTFPRLFPDEAARVCAASNTSSSSETVVLM